MDLSKVFPLLIAFFILMAAIGALLGLWRRTKRATVRLVAVILSAVLAVLLSGALASLLDAAWVESQLTRLATAFPEQAEMFTELSTLSEAIATLMPLVHGLLRPLMFVILLIGFSAFLWVVVLIVGLFLGKKEKKKSSGSRLLDRLMGGLIGLVQGVLVAALLLSPAVGYLAMADDIATAYVETSESESAEELRELQAEYLTPLRENPVIKVTESMTSPIFSATSSFRVGEERTSILEEVPIFFNMIDALRSLGGVPLEQYGDAECDALRDITALFSDSALLPPVTAELLSTVAGRWQAGEDFLGLEAPVAEGDLAPVLDALITVLASTDEVTVRRDLETITDFLILTVDYGILAEAAGGDPFAKAIELNPETDKTFLRAAIDLLDENPHMAPIRDGITAFGASLVAAQLGTPEEIRENYGDMVTSAVEILKDVEGDTNEEKIAALTPVLQENLEAEGIDLPQDAVDEASRFLLDELESRDISLEELTEDDIYDILDQLAAGNV